MTRWTRVQTRVVDDLSLSLSCFRYILVHRGQKRTCKLKEILCKLKEILGEPCAMV